MYVIIDVSCMNYEQARLTIEYKKIVKPEVLNKQDLPLSKKIIKPEVSNK